MARMIVGIASVSLARLVVILVDYILNPEAHDL